MCSPRGLPLSFCALAVVIGGLAACDGVPTTTTAESAIDVGTCDRNPAVFEGRPVQCPDNTRCPCGSFCDLEAGVCRYECMPPGQAPSNPERTFPGDPSECSTGNLCDDRGRCAAIGGPPGTSVVLGADPIALTTVAGGPSKPLEVRLRLTNPSPAELAASQATVVHVRGRDFAKVACDGTTFQTDCELTGWTFAFNGQVLEATKTARVKTDPDAPEHHGEVVLSIETTGAQLIVPAGAVIPLVNEDGIYTGVATSPAYPAGIQVSARVRQRQLLVREPSRTIAPDGALLLDVRATGTPGPRRRTVWLRSADAPATAPGIVGEYGAELATIDLERGTIDMPLTFDIPGAVGLTGWTLALTRMREHVAECATDSACKTGEVCAAGLQACVPATVMTPTTAQVGNALDDKRSADWWAAVLPMLTTSSAFATTGANLIESLICTVDNEFPGRLGVAQYKLPTATRSRSGDLVCVDGAPAHAPAPGAVGLATIADRETDPRNVMTPQLLDACMRDLKRLPATAASFGGAFGVTVGSCANLARFIPAMRLIATDELNRRTTPILEPRARGLLVRLTQQWSMLNGLLASAGVSVRDSENVLDPTPAATVRARLLELFDMVDRGWSALLDRRIAAAVRGALPWSPVTRNDQLRDYRLVKKPVVYWTFNNKRDYRGTELVPNGPAAGVCAISTSGSSFTQGFNCPGYSATLPPTAPSLVDSNLGGKLDNLTVTITVDARDVGGPGTGGSTQLRDVNACPVTGCEDPEDPPEDDPPPDPPQPPPPYRGGTLVATPTLAVAESVNSTTQDHSIVLVHPTSTGIEWTHFLGTGDLGSSENTSGEPPTTITIVRDAQRKTYTLMTWRGTSPIAQRTQAYVHDPVGALDWVPPTTIRVGAAGPLAAGHYWAPYRKSYGGMLDDLAVFESALSAREVEDFASARGNGSQGVVWPVDAPLQVLPPAEDTEDIAVPLGAHLLEAQVAELELAARVMMAMQERAAIACDPDQVAAAAARAEVDAAIARAGRALRQSHLVEGMAEADTGTRAAEARVLLAAKRMELARVLEPTRCTPPFEMAENEVPLYHDSINPAWSETEAYFAASDHMLGLAHQRASDALGALTAARQAYVAARESQIQQAQSDLGRELRLEAVEAQYGDGLRRLCGISGSTNHEIIKDLYDPDPERPPFYVDTCFIEASAGCLAQIGSPLAQLEPSCYRGQIGENLMSLRTAYLAQQTAIQSWRSAIDSATAAQQFCVWKQRNAFGCAPGSGVTCPDGTLQLIAEFNNYVNGVRNTKQWWTGIGNILAAAASAYVARVPVRPPSPRVQQASLIPGLAIIGLAVGAAVVRGVSDAYAAGEENAIDERRRKLEETLAHRSAQADVIACWNQADQYERATRAAELAAGEAIAQFEAAGLGFANTLGEARQIVIEAPVAVAREQNRPTIPIAFHYWLDEHIATFQRLFASARRYTYVALRATEYDKQTTYKAPEAGSPQRAAVLGATHPQQLLDQIMLMRDQTNTRSVHGRSPALGWTTISLAQRFWGLPSDSMLVGQYLAASLRDVFTPTGQYLGRGLRFSLIPQSSQDKPVLRCAERIWRVAVGAAPVPGWPIPSDPDLMVTKLLKRNLFASRVCGGDGSQLQPAIWRPESNLLAHGGEATTFESPVSSTPANTPLARLANGGELDQFRHSSTPPQRSSSELSLQGLFGDYVLLFPKTALEHGLVPASLYELNIRFDHVSIDDTRDPQGVTTPGAERDATAPVQVELDADRAPIIVD